MSYTVFYAWQSDTAEDTNHHFIAEALKTAITRLNVGLNLHESEATLAFDRDTHGEPGMPAVADTLLRKIATASMFVADLTFVAQLVSKDKGLPNANVGIELGYAARALTFDRIVCVFNRHYGKPDRLPFDLAHRRFPVEYTLAPDASSSERERALQVLTHALTQQLRTIVDRIGLLEPTDPEEIPAHAAAPLSHCAFVEGARQIAQTNTRDNEGRESEYVFWHEGPSAWLRLIPAQSKHLSRVNLGRIVNGAFPLQSFGEHANRRIVSNEFGAVVIGYDENEPPAIATDITQVFKSGEVWGLNRSLIEPRRVEPHRTFQIPWPATQLLFRATLSHYVAFAQQVLQAALPITIVAGLAMVDQALFVPAKRQWVSDPEKPTRCFERFIRIVTTLAQWEADQEALLDPFFARILEACEQDYQEWRGIRWPKA